MTILEVDSVEDCAALIESRGLQWEIRTLGDAYTGHIHDGQRCVVTTSIPKGEALLVLMRKLILKGAIHEYPKKK